MLIAAMLASARAPAADPTGWHYVAYHVAPTPALAIVAEAAVARLPHAAIFADYCATPLRYRFPVPDGAYVVRLHHLQLPGGRARNNGALSAVANGVMVADEVPVWLANMPLYGPKSGSVPVDAVAIVSEATVEAVGGAIDLSFLNRKRTRQWGVHGIEILGPGVAIRVDCGAPAARTDAAGQTWEPDAGRRRPMPAGGAVTLGERDRTPGTWIDVSGDLLLRMGGQAGVTPFRSGWRMLCDRRGNTYFLAHGIGCWRYDWSAGTATRLDGGVYTADPIGTRGERGSACVDANPVGAGVLLMGTAALSHPTFAARSLDGSAFERIPGFPQQNGVDWISVDWTATPPVVFAKLHHTKGRTALSSDGGGSWRQIGDDGGNLAAILAAGGGILVKSLHDGTILRSSDLGATWSVAASVPRTPPRGEAFMRRVGDALLLNTTAGHLGISTDAGSTWTAIDGAPAFRQAVEAGRGEDELLGFTELAAYGSVDAGRTWTRITPDAPGGGWGERAGNAWAYDAALDALYYSSAGGGVYRFARK